MVVVQYPHFLFVQELEGKSYQDDDGNWVTDEPSWIYHSKCREETNGKGSYINTVDGEHIMFSSLIQLPKGTKSVTEGRKVVVSDIDSYNDGVRLRGHALKFDNGQLHCRLWV